MCADDARMGEKGGMQLSKSEVLVLVVYVQLWVQRFVFLFFEVHSHTGSFAVALRFVCYGTNPTLSKF